MSEVVEYKKSMELPKRIAQIVGKLLTYPDASTLNNLCKHIKDLDCFDTLERVPEEMVGRGDLISPFLFATALVELDLHTKENDLEPLSDDDLDSFIDGAIWTLMSNLYVDLYYSLNKHIVFKLLGDWDKYCKLVDFKMAEIKGEA
jgi:hypothetical protein